MVEPDHARNIFTVSAETACGTNVRLGYRVIGIENSMPSANGEKPLQSSCLGL